METHKNKQHKIDTILESVNVINDVKVSPFFKDKVLQRLYAEKEAKQTIWSWFTPQLQLATLVCVVVLNVFALTQLDLSNNTSDLDEFAQSYDLSVTDESSIFN